jgi:hypothetical protein
MATFLRIKIKIPLAVNQIKHYSDLFDYYSDKNSAPQTIHTKNAANTFHEYQAPRAAQGTLGAGLNSRQKHDSQVGRRMVCAV